MTSSLSFNLPVSAIMISLYLSKSCLYLSTCDLSSWIYYLSFSNSYSFYSYSSLMIFYFFSSATLNYGVSSIILPPTSTYEFIILIFYSRIFFSSLSLIYSSDLASRALMAASLSSSALLFSSSSFMTW